MIAMILSLLGFREKRKQKYDVSRMRVNLLERARNAALWEQRHLEREVKVHVSALEVLYDNIPNDSLSWERHVWDEELIVHGQAVEDLTRAIERLHGFVQALDNKIYENREVLLALAQ